MRVDLQLQGRPDDQSPGRPRPAPHPVRHPAEDALKSLLLPSSTQLLHPSTPRSDPSSSAPSRSFSSGDRHPQPVCSVNISRTVAGEGQCCYNPVFKLTAACWRGQKSTVFLKICIEFYEILQRYYEQILFNTDAWIAKNRNNIYVD